MGEEVRLNALIDYCMDIGDEEPCHKNGAKWCENHCGENVMPDRACWMEFVRQKVEGVSNG